MIAYNAKVLEEDTVSYTILESSDVIAPYSLGYKGSNFKIFSDKNSYRLFYMRLHIDEVPKPLTPSVDFETKRVLFISYGKYRNAGCLIKLLNIYIKNDVLIVEADNFLIPNLTQLVTHCYLLVLVPNEGYKRAELRNSKGEVLENAIIRPLK
jgi:hypothetical protein